MDDLHTALEVFETTASQLGLRVQAEDENSDPGCGRTNIQPISLWSVCGGSSWIYIFGLCSVYHWQVLTRYSQADWHCLHCHAVYEQSLATVSASTADETPLIPDLYIVHPTVQFGSMDTSAGRLYGSLRPSTCAASVWSSGYAGMTSSEIQKSPTLPTCPVSRTSSPGGETHYLAMCGLDNHTQIYCALSQLAAIQTGSCPPGWHWRTGRPRNSWLQQIAEWTRARRCGHTGTGLTQWTSAVYAI